MKTMKLVGKDWVFQQFVLWQSQLLRIRRDFHEHPELGFQTHRTAKRIADILLRFGVRHIDLKSVPGGVIAVITSAGDSLTSGITIRPLSRCGPGLTPLR